MIDIHVRNKQAVTTGHEFSKELTKMQPPLTTSLRVTKPLTRLRDIAKKKLE